MAEYGPISPFKYPVKKEPRDFLANLIGSPFESKDYRHLEVPAVGSDAAGADHLRLRDLVALAAMGAAKYRIPNMIN